MEKAHNGSRYSEIPGILLLMLSIIIFLSLYSYTITDYDKLVRNIPVDNIIGPVGAAIANMLRGAFGYSSYLVFVITAFMGWTVLSRKQILNYMERIFSLTYLLITSSALIALIFPEIVPQFSGGFIGMYLTKILHGFAGKAGCYVLIIFFNIIGLILLGVFSVSLIINGTARSDNIFSKAYKYLSRKIFIMKNRERIPVNNIEEAIKKGSAKRKKPPWITREKVKFYKKGKALDDNENGIRGPMLLENKWQDPGNAINLREAENHLSRELFSNEAFTAVNETEMYNVEKSSDNLKFDTDNTEDAPFEAEEKITTQAGSGDSRLILDGIEVNRIKFIEDEEKKDAVENSRSGSGAAMAVEDTEEREQECAEDTQDAEEDWNETLLEENDEYADGLYDNYSKVFGVIHLNKEYTVPTSYLESSGAADTESWQAEIRRNSELLVNTLKDFGIESRVIKVNRGPVITLYEMQIAPGIKVNKIVGLADDIAMALAASRVRIVAPIPGKSAIGVEVPNLIREIVTLGDVIKSQEYKSMTGRLKVALGQDILGKPITLDLKRLPHLLIAGATGSGKSVLVNNIITSLVYNYDPNYIKFIMVDPKMVELQLYNGLPHLLTPVITEPHAAPKALKWAMFEMERRYRLLSALNTRGIEKYNEKIIGMGDEYERLPYIVIIMDELADLMMVAAKDIEGYITRIAQKARAVGIHLVLATQRPSVNIITGIIKANFPARIAFQVAQKIDSRTIIDQNGAEKLLGAGDMLYQSPLSSFPVRIQSAFISENEIMEIVNHLKGMGKPIYIDIEEDVYEAESAENEDFEDELFAEAMKIVEETRKASASYLQRRLSIGYNRAARIIEMMEDRGYISQQQGSKPREVYI